MVLWVEVVVGWCFVGVVFYFVFCLFAPIDGGCSWCVEYVKRNVDKRKEVESDSYSYQIEANKETLHTVTFDNGVMTCIRRRSRLKPNTQQTHTHTVKHAHTFGDAMRCKCVQYVFQDATEIALIGKCDLRPRLMDKEIFGAYRFVYCLLGGDAGWGFPHQRKSCRKQFALQSLFASLQKKHTSIKLWSL